MSSLAEACDLSSWILARFHATPKVSLCYSGIRVSYSTGGRNTTREDLPIRTGQESVEIIWKLQQSRYQSGAYAIGSNNLP